MKRSLRLGAVVMSAAAAACRSETKIPATDSSASSDPQATSAAATAGAPVSGARVAVAHSGPAGEWQMPAGDYAPPRFSEPPSPTPQNAAQLHVARGFSARVMP